LEAILGFMQIPLQARQTESGESVAQPVAQAVSHGLLSDAYGWTKDNVLKPFANGVLVSVNDVSEGTNWLAKKANLPEVMPHIAEWKSAPIKPDSAASYVRGCAGFAGDVAPLIVVAAVAKFGQRFSFLKGAEREEPISPFAPVENNEIRFNSRGHIGGETEGNVYDNLDGTVTKVFHANDHDVQGTVSLYQRLHSIGVNVPEVLQYGTTAEGKPAIVMQRIGDGDHLKFKLTTGAIQGAEKESLRKQYYALGDKLAQHKISIDWNTSNMIFDKNKLYVVDPSWLKEQPMSKAIVDLFAGPIGPR
jgi:hypothetical protein